MRTLVHGRQKIWVTEITETLDGIDTVETYSNPIMRKEVVTETNRDTVLYGAGIDEVYDRYIVTYDKKFVYKPGMQVYIDVKPELTNCGCFIYDDNGNPTVKPDYYVKRILTGQKTISALIGLKRLGARVGET